LKGLLKKFLQLGTVLIEHFSTLDGNPSKTLFGNCMFSQVRFYLGAAETGGLVGLEDTFIVPRDAESVDWAAPDAETGTVCC